MDWPWREDGEELVHDQDVWQRWEAYEPTGLVESLKDNLLRLRIMFDGGIVEPSNLGPARAFHEALLQAGVPHAYEEFSGNHFDQSPARLESAILPFLSAQLIGEAASTVVQTTTWGAAKLGSSR